MEKTLVKKSEYLKLKYKFFINRILIYFSFLLIPLWLQDTEDLNLLVQSGILLVYLLFMGGQWYFFGKEIDNRLKIYYRANSSMERIVYRITLGSIGMILLFNIFSLFPSVLHQYIFWGFFAIVGLFYSWPTRGKIIEESMISQFGEMKYMDSFERTILLLTGFTFIISLPEVQLFQNIDALKLYLDPSENVSAFLWNFLSFIYTPFVSIPKLYNLIWCFHFYFFGLGLFIFSFYCLMRYLFSRRLALLGVYAIVSTWSFSKILGLDFFSTMTTTVSILWLWSLVWSSHSGTYRAGLFTGLVGSYMAMINPVNFLLVPVGIIISYFFYFKERTQWFKQQWLKYNILGFAIALMIFGFKFESIEFSFFNLYLAESTVLEHLNRKAFFVISPVGLILGLFYLSGRSRTLLTYVGFDKFKFKQVFYGLIVVILFGVFIQPEFVAGFTFIWILSLLAVIPIEWVFQTISRLRSKRNIIYAIYILVCLLDSHLENRLRIIGKIFFDMEILKYFIQL